MHTYTSPSFLIILLFCLGIGLQLPAQTPLILAWENSTPATTSFPMRVLENPLDGSVYTIHHLKERVPINPFFRKISPTGEVLWTYSFYDVTFFPNGVIDAAVDGAGNLITVFYSEFFAGSSHESHAGVLMHILKLNPEGELLWQQQYRSSDLHYAIPNDMYVDEDNNIFIAGRRVSAQNQATDYEAIVVAYDPSGELRWETQLGEGHGIRIKEENGKLLVARRETFVNHHIYEIEKETGNYIYRLNLQNINAFSYFRWFEDKPNYYFEDRGSYAIMAYDTSGEVTLEYGLDEQEGAIDEAIETLVDSIGYHYVLGRKDRKLWLSKLDDNSNLIWESTLNSLIGSCYEWKCHSSSKLTMRGNSLFVFDRDTSQSLLRLHEFDIVNGDLLQTITRQIEVPGSFSTTTSHYWGQDAVYLLGEIHENGEEYFVFSKYDLLPTSVADPFTTSPHLLVYPNPAQDRIWLSAGELPITQIHLYSMLGQPLRSWSDISSPAMSVALTDVPAGLYWLSCYIGDIQVWRQLVKE